MATKSLYVGNLSYSTTEEALTAFFAPYGATASRIVQGRGFGFVDVEADKMEDAINERNNAELDGRKLTVNEARPREERSGGGGRFGGGGGGGYGGGGGRFGGGGGGGGRGGDRFDRGGGDRYDRGDRGDRGDRRGGGGGYGGGKRKSF